MATVSAALVLVYRGDDRIYAGSTWEVPAWPRQDKVLASRLTAGRQ